MTGDAAHRDGFPGVRGGERDPRGLVSVWWRGFWGCGVVVWGWICVGCVGRVK